MELVLLDVADAETAQLVLGLQRRAYRVEADLIGSDHIPPLHETLADLQASGETFLGAFLDGRLVGFVSWKLLPATLDLHRLAVDPACFRRGVGRALVRGALAAEPDAARAIVQTGSANEPAKRLYRTEGFREVSEHQPVPGLTVTTFERAAAQPARGL
jgi:ribosomal protein S18 acetylase RimI-like enzyme